MKKETFLVLVAVESKTRAIDVIKVKAKNLENAIYKVSREINAPIMIAITKGDFKNAYHLK